MRTFAIILFLRILLLTEIIETAFSQTSSSTIPSAAINEDPNLNPYWDWRIGDFPNNTYPYAQYKFYHQNSNGEIVVLSVEAPTAQPNAWTGLLDNRKEDGWILLSKDFGTPLRPVSGLKTIRPAHFILYNKYRSLIRFFINVNEEKTYNKGFVELQFKDKDNTSKTPAVLAHLKPLAEAVDAFTKMRQNSSSVFSEIMRKDVWLWADFPISYDPTLAPKTDDDPPSFYFRVYGQMVSDISLKGTANGMQGNASAINKYLTGASGGNGPLGIPGLTMPNLSLGDNNLNLSGMGLKTASTQTSWGSFGNYFESFKATLPVVNASNPFSGLISGFSSKLSSLSNLLPIGLPGLDIGGVFDFFVGGGAKMAAAPEPAPTYIAMNFELSGTITSSFPVHEIRVTIPSTRDGFWKPALGSGVGIIRNEPLGTIALTKTPVVLQKSFTQTIVDHYDLNGEPVYSDLSFTEYEITNNIELAVNNYSELELVKTEVSLLANYTFVNNIAHMNMMSWIDRAPQNHLVEFDSPADAQTITLRSMPVAAQYAKGRAIQIPSNGASFPRLKIKAVFKRKDDPAAQPVVFISTYRVDVKEGDGDCCLPQQTLPPQGLQSNIPTTGGVKVFWARNSEKSVKYYSVERSINGGSYVIIKNTTDTVIVDNEVQKSVKPYLSNRINVTVSYRVRAYSEWIGDDSYTHSQYSVYGNPILLSGSIIGTFSKFGSGQIVPDDYSLSQNFPNPFNPSTTIYYGVKKSGLVNVKVFNALGQEVATLVNDVKEVGYHYAEWNASGLPSGMYFYRITVGEFTETKKMTLMK